MSFSLHLHPSGESAQADQSYSSPSFKFLRKLIVLLFIAVGFRHFAFAAVTASILGSVRDSSGAVIPGAKVTATNIDTHVSQVVTTNDDGVYNFPALQPGKYDVGISMPGFKAFKQTGMVLNVNDALTVDAIMQIGQNDESVTVSANALRVETTTTQLGEVIEGQQITSVPLNGRSYTDLLALQPGVSNTNSGIGGGSSTSNTFQSAGILFPSVSGDANAGNQSVNGMRESANGYLLNGISVQEFAYSGTAVVPNLDSLSEFRIITNNFDAEYGNFSGGQVNVVTKAGANQLHGDVFEFLRNTDFDAANYFDQNKRGPFQQNEFGGTVGGPIVKNKAFFFGDYQGNRNVLGVSTGVIDVPTAAERAGDFSQVLTTLPNGAKQNAMIGSSVIGTAWANTLSNMLGYPVFAGESYYTANCTNSTQCVFPNAFIPSRVISPISKNVLALGAIPTGNGNGVYSTSAYPQRLTDDKFSGRVDENTGIGTLFGYYIFDQFTLARPYPTATVPGFAGNTTGRTQAIDIGDTKPIGSHSVNEVRLGYLRVNDALNKPASSINATLTGLGFANSGAPGGITPLDPADEGIPEMDFENFAIGQPSRTVRIIENTFQASDNYSRLVGNHSLKFGVAYHFTQLKNEGPTATTAGAAPNGYFQFNQTLETGVDFADFLIGAPGVFEQGQAPPANQRNFYLGAFAQDSWRVRSSLTLNYGLRWDVITPWWDKNNELETLKLGEQSVVFPNSPMGWVFPGDPGIPKTIAPIRYDNFAPRVGLAYAPSFSSGLPGKLFGGAGQTSIRAGYGMFYSAFEGAYAFSVIGDAPYGYFYSANGTSFANPYQSRATGTITPSPFPYSFPPTNVSAKNPDGNVPASAFGVIGTSPGFNPNNRVPYAEQYELSLERQITSADILTLSYVGTQGHRLLVTQEANPVNQAACLAIYNLNPTNPACGPNAEPNSLRAPFGANFGSEGYFSTIGNSAYSSAQINFKHRRGPLQFLLGYTYSKSMDDSSAFGEQVNPYQANLTRALSSFNQPQNFVVSYTYTLPTDHLGGPKLLVNGWQISGITSYTKGLPVYIYENDDRSLLGTDNSGPLPLGIDTPNFAGGPVKLLNPRTSNGGYFNTSAFSAETIGSLGTARRRFFAGPGIDNYNMALVKNTQFSERYNLQFRAEFFNVFNHTQFSAVNGNFNSPTFGQATAAADPRIGQLALKLSF